MRLRNIKLKYITIKFIITKQLPKSSAEICAFAAPLLAIQIRSDIASEAPKAQHEPHEP